MHHYYTLTSLAFDIHCSKSRKPIRKLVAKQENTEIGVKT